MFKLKIEKIYSKPIEKVWNAISNEEAVKKWFMNIKFDSLVGGDYYIEEKPTDVWDGKIYGKIITFQAPNLFEHTWKTNELAEDTLVRWELEEVDGGTKLTLTHNHYTELQFNKHNEGWNYFVIEIEKYLNNEENSKKVPC